MGVEYRIHLVPRNRTYRPPSSSMDQFIKRLESARFVPPGLPDDSQKFELSSRVLPHADKLEKALQRPLTNEAKELIAQMRQASEAVSVESSLDAAWFAAAEGKDYVLSWELPETAVLKLQHPLETAHPNTRDWEECGYYFHVASNYDYEDLALDEMLGIVDATCKCGRQLRYDCTADTTIGPMEKIAYRCLACNEVFDPSSLESWSKNWEGQQKTPIAGGGCTRFALTVDVGKAIPNAAPVLKAELIDLCRDVFAQDFVQVGEIA